MTAALRRPGLIAAFALTVAVTGAATPVSVLRSPTAIPHGSLTRASLAPSGSSGGSPPRASTAIPPPRHQGTLRITGSLRDGGTARAVGLSWRPGKLPAGDRLLSFEVGYYWDACSAAGTTSSSTTGRQAGQESSSRRAPARRARSRKPVRAARLS